MDNLDRAVDAIYSVCDQNESVQQATVRSDEFFPSFGVLKCKNYRISSSIRTCVENFNNVAQLLIKGSLYFSLVIKPAYDGRPAFFVVPFTARTYCVIVPDFVLLVSGFSFLSQFSCVYLFF